MDEHLRVARKTIAERIRHENDHNCDPVSFDERQELHAREAI